MMRKLKYLGALLLAATVAACGGGGGSPGTVSGGSGGTTTKPVPAALEIFTSPAELSTSATSSISFTVVAKDSSNQAIPGQTVTFSASSGNLIGALPTPSTGAAGEPITSVSLTPGADRSNRTITVTIRAGGVSQDIVVPVTGSRLAITGDTSMLLNGTASLTVRALDSASLPVPGATVTLNSALGNPISPTSGTTNSQGAATFSYTGTRGGVDTVTASGLGASVTSTMSVSADVFVFESPAANTVVAVGATQTATIRYLRNNLPVVGQAVTFSTTRGSVTPTSKATDANGRASTVFSSSTSGPASIVAQVPNAQVTLPLTFVATNPASLVLQANPGAIAPNAAGSTVNQVGLVATVRDPVGNPVAGRRVNFTAITDGSNGTITPGSATTDASGQATSQFIPGGASTANNGVVISATVTDTSITGTASLTVNAQALFISIAASNVIANRDPQTYQKTFSVYVTDANGAPAGNRVVNLEVFPVSYFKGTMSNIKIDATGAEVKGDWYIASSSPSCPNEDLNRNGILNVGEDSNGSGKLEPGLPVVVSPATVTTDASGFATFDLFYGENYALWVDTIITARTSVGGTESVKTFPYFLYALLADIQGAATPAGAESPFGTSTSCSSPN